MDKGKPQIKSPQSSVKDEIKRKRLILEAIRKSKAKSINQQTHHIEASSPTVCQPFKFEQQPQPQPSSSSTITTTATTTTKTTSGGSLEPIQSKLLSVVYLAGISIEPKEITTYDRQTQKDSENVIESNLTLERYECDFEYEHESDEEPLDEQQIIVKNEIEEDEINIKEYDELEKRRIFDNEKFNKFLDHALRVTDRILYCNESVNNKIDYFNGEETVDSNVNSLSLNRCFYKSGLCKDRVVTCFDWSSLHCELLLTTYNHNNDDDNKNDNDGACIVWNMKYSNVIPEYAFHYDSALMSGCFAKFHPNLLICGTHSGQIIMWDIRSRRSSPVQRSILSPLSHTHPVYCLQMMGSQNANNLISLSNDGKLCTWSLNMMTKPLSTRELEHESISSPLSLKISRPVLASSMSFPLADYDHIVIGSEEGHVYSTRRNATNADIHRFSESHQQLVTNVSCHPQIDFSNLFLTSSLDWTIKLWDIKEENPIHTFRNNFDAIYDTRWSPVNPALFASVGALGQIDLWDINNELHSPTSSVTVNDSQALNKIVWTPSGKQLVAGDQAGRVWLYDVCNHVSEDSDKHEETQRLLSTLQEMKKQDDLMLNL